MIHHYFTICSALLFFFTLCIENCPQSHPTILVLIASSLVYKYTYIFHPKNTNILSIATKFDHLCIINLIMFHFTNLNFYLKTVIRLLTILDYRFMYMIFGTLLTYLFYELFTTNIFLGVMLSISTFFSYIGYVNYLKNGWNVYNSWIWHYATTCLVMTVKLSYHIQTPPIF